MLVKRTMKVDVELFEVGDIIKFKLTDGEKVQAMAVKQTPEGMLFVLVDCLAKEYPMFNDIDDMDEEDISYATSDLRKALNGEILDRFPKEIKDRMVAVNAEGDMLRIPTECEIFGENVYGQEESKLTKRWKPMKKKRNRIAFQGKEGAWEWYWLMNRHKNYASYFAYVSAGGIAGYGRASTSGGVRPVFLLS
jgi:hypothetical protein